MSLAKVRAALLNLIKRIRVSAVDNSGLIQTVTVELYSNDKSEMVERHQQYGHCSHPDPESDLAGVVVTVAGQRFVLALDDPKHRPKDAEPGEVDVWHKNGVRMRLKNDETVETICKQYLVKASEKVRLETPRVETTGEIHSDGDQVAAGISQTQHLHKEQGDGANVSPPIAAAE